MSQHPKIGPFCWLHAIANCDKFRLNFSFIVIEKINEVSSLSVVQCFLEEFQVREVYPPITFPNSVSTRTIVCGTSSHFLWKASALNRFSLALKMFLIFLMFLFGGNSDLTKSNYFVILLSMTSRGMTGAGLLWRSFFFSSCWGFWKISVTLPNDLLISSLMASNCERSNTKSVFVRFSSLINSSEITSFNRYPVILSKS